MSELVYTATEQLDVLEKMIRRGYTLKVDGIFLHLVHKDGVTGHRYTSLSEILNYCVYEQNERFLR